MAFEIWPFTINREGLDEHFAPRDNVSEGDNTGPITVLIRPPRFMVRGDILFPDTNGQRFDDWALWYETKGSFVQFFYKSNHPAYREELDVDVGTSSGGAGEFFPLKHLHIDATTLVVKVDTVIQGGGTFQLNDNDVDPIVETLAGFDAGSVTISNEYFHLMQHAVTPQRNRMLVSGRDLTSQGTVRQFIELLAVSGNGHLVAP